MWGASCRPFTKPLSKVLGVPVVCLPARTRSYQSARVSRVLKRFRDHNKQLIVLDDGSYFLEVRRGYWCVAASGLFQAFWEAVLLKCLCSCGWGSRATLPRSSRLLEPVNIIAATIFYAKSQWQLLPAGYAQCVLGTPLTVSLSVSCFSLGWCLRPAPPPSLSLPLARDFCSLSAGIKYHETVW